LVKKGLNEVLQAQAISWAGLEHRMYLADLLMEEVE
jgi:hypothetical protein